MEYYGVEVSDEQKDEIMHYGVLRKSGRFPWGSGDNPNQRNKDFLAYVDDLKRKGLSDVEIAKGIGLMDPDSRRPFTTTQLRASKAIAKAEQKAADISEAQKFKDKGYSNVAIGERMGIPESSVRALLKPGADAKTTRLENTMDVLREQVKEKTYLDVGTGTERYMNISDTQLKTAIAGLKEEGYSLEYVKIQQVGTGEYTTFKVLVPPGVTSKDVWRDQDKIRSFEGQYTEDGGLNYNKILPPKNIDSSRVSIRYGNEGGADMDGVIELRRGVDDISLGDSRYAQVRMGVDGSHYLKGMAIYADDLPDGVDVRFNTNKNTDKIGTNKLDAMKKQNLVDPNAPLSKDNPVDETNAFGAEIRRQNYYTDAKGNKVQGKMNIVNEEGQWGEWSRSLSSQVLSKQQPSLAKQQLDLTFASKKEAFDEINALTNVEVKKKMLMEFSDAADSSSVHLSAAALPRQGTHVILPMNKLKPTEVYAPNYNDGEVVALVRFPHGGKFEIPELVVNNKSREAKRLMNNAKDAIGINSKVAERLSGADFDGDTVLVIPNNSGKLKSSPALQGLKNFDPQRDYPKYEGMKVMSPRTKQIQMGEVSNLITDMTIRGASDTELARAVRHSMVVIDAEKHKLNYKQSAQDNGISELKAKYQGSARAGASTLISRASSQKEVLERKERSAAEGGAIDKETGKRMYTPTNNSYVVPAYTKTTKSGKTVMVPERTVMVRDRKKSTKMAEVDDARDLFFKDPDTGAVQARPIEVIYANHANRLKALANDARKAAVNLPSEKQSQSAKATYANEVQSLQAKLNIALKNAPRERQAQVLANAQVAAKRRARPDMEPDQIKKVKNQALVQARQRTGAKKTRITPTQKEWAAIQANAISANQLRQILANADMDEIKKLATPRTNLVMTPAKQRRAEAMLNAGYTQAEVAGALGVPTSTLNSSIS